MQWLCTQLTDSAHDPIPLPLDFAARQRSRQRLALGDDVLAIALPTGTTLKAGDVLRVDGHPGFLVVAAPQALMRVSSTDPLLLTRAAYHLGNRHCTIQIGAYALLLERDEVLRDMLIRLGASVDDVVAPFEPESGAYGGGHKHGHDQTFDSDYALAQSTYHLHEGKPVHSVLRAHVDHD